MAENQNQPNDGEAVLGGNIPEPGNSPVLGGIEGVKSRLASGDDNQKIAALHQAWNYGEDGIKLVLCALKDKSLRVRKFASTLLKENLTIKQNLELLLSTLKDGSGSVQYAVCSLLEAKEPALKEALQAYNPYQLTCFRILEGPFSGNTAFSPDGTTLASALWTYSTIQLWDVGTGALKSTFTERSSKDIQSIAFSPDGQTLAIGSPSTRSGWSTIQLWNTATKTLRSTLTIRASYYVKRTACSPDGKTLASYSSHFIQLEDTATETLRQTLRKTLTGHVKCMAFSPDGKTLASSSYKSYDDTIKLWDTATETLRSTLTGHSDYVKCIAFSPDGKTLASVSYDGTIKLWDTATETLRSTLTSYVECIAFSPDGKTLASVSYNGTIELWDTATETLRSTLTSHSSYVKCIAFSPDGKTLASVSYPIIEFSPDDKTLASGSYPTIELWDTATETLSSTLPGSPHSIESVAFSPDGKILVITCEDGIIQLWDPHTGHTKTLRSTLTLESSNDVKCIAFSPDGKTLASYSSHNIKLGDTATGAVRTTLTGHSNYVTCITFSPYGKMLASCSHDGTIKLWDTATETLGSTLTGHSGPVESVAFSPYGKMLASCSHDGTIKLWDTATGSLIRTLEVGSTGLSVVFTPDGKILAITRGDGIIQLWHTDTGQLITSSTKGIENGGPMAISRDGKMLAIRCSDWTIKLWRIGHINQSTLDIGELFNRYFALKEALESGQAGLDLIVSALKDKSFQVRQIAFSLLSKLQEPSVTQALEEYGSEPLYARLRYLLAAERWKEAEEETENILLILSGCEKGADIQTVLNQHTIYKKLDNSPGPDKYSLRCKILDRDLETISELWENYSNSRASFSEQKLSLAFWLGCKEEIDRYFESARRMARNFEAYEREYYAAGYGIDRS